MYLDLTFRFEVPDDQLPLIQLPIAEHANVIQSDKKIIVDVAVPIEEPDHPNQLLRKRRYAMRGVLVDAKEGY
jgi:hypothetical protein